jgi:hypothetical protein
MLTFTIAGSFDAYIYIATKIRAETLIWIHPFGHRCWPSIEQMCLGFVVCMAMRDETTIEEKREAA